VLLLVLLGSIPFMPALGSDFFWDDDRFVVHNPLIKDVNAGNVARMFVDTTQEKYLIPFVHLSLALDFAIWKYDPMGYHITNILFHVSNTLLVFLLVLTLFHGDILLAVLAAAMFSAHPQRVESVAWITERKDVLFLFFYLVSMLFYIEFIKRRKSRFYLLSLAAFLASVLSKPMAVSLPVVLVLLDYFFRNRIALKDVLNKLPFVAAALFIGIVAMMASEFSTESGRPVTIISALISAKIFWTYVVTFFYPVNLAVYHPYPEELTEYSFWLWTAAACFWAFLGFLVAIMKRYRTVFFCSCFFAVTILPKLQIIKVGSDLYADRFMYLPSIGISLLVCLGALRLYRAAGTRALKAAVLAPLFLIVVIAMPAVTWRRARVWRSPVALWREVLERYPDDLFTNALVSCYYNREFEAAEDGPEREAAYLKTTEALERMLRMCRERYGPADGRSMALSGIDQSVFGHVTLRRISKAHSLYYFCALRLGELYYYKGEYAKAKEKFLIAQSVGPEEPAVYDHLGRTALQTRDFDEAIRHFRRGSELDPANYKWLLNEGLCFEKKNVPEKALEVYNRALAIEPDSPLVLYRIGKALIGIGKMAEAERHLERALALAPDAPLRERIEDAFEEIREKPE